MNATIKFGIALLSVYFGFVGGLIYAETRMELAAVSAGFLITVVGLFFYYGKLDKE